MAALAKPRKSPAQVGELVQIAGCDIIIGIDIQAVTIEALPISINVENIVGNIPIDISAQSVGNIAVDIVAQTLGTIAISINVADITGNLPIDIKAQTVGNIGIDIKAATVKVGITLNVADITGNIPIDIKAQTLGTVAISINVANITGNLPIDIKAQTLGTVAISINVANITGNLPIDIKAQTVGNIGIDIKAQTVGNINVDIKAQTVDLNIKTSGGVNIIIDKLTQTAFTPRSVDLKNDNGVTAPSAPPSSETGVTYRGKFFPRGARGLLGYLLIYCKRTASGTLTLAYAPQPGMGKIGSVTITPTSSWAWRSASVFKFWNYDSLFIWVESCGADVSWGYDSTAPYDQFGSGDSGVTWYPQNYRLFIWVGSYGQNIGDIPVSGIVNTIEVPSAIATREYVTLDVPASSELLDTLQPGSGGLLFAFFYAGTADGVNNLRPRIYCDGESVLPRDATLATWSIHVTAASQGICLGWWSTSENQYNLIVVIHYPFKRSLQLGFYNQHASNAITGRVGYSYKKIV